MRIARGHAPARAALVGNPSDGYGGRTISLALADFGAEAAVYEWPELEIVPSAADRGRFPGLRALRDEVRAHGLDGGTRLVKATVVRFAEHLEERGIDSPEATFAVRYATDVPRGVGLAGSSAIVVAVLRALCEFHGVEIRRELLPGLALAVETEELGIAAGLQDRVAQAYGGLVSMDFEPGHLAKHGHGRYEPLDPSLLPPLFLAWLPAAAQPSTLAHADVRGRHARGEPDVVAAMSEMADLARRAHDHLLEGDHAALGELIDGNFEARRRVFDLDPRHVDMVEVARGHGAPAHFAGSGGALLGIVVDEERWPALRAAYESVGCRAIRPTVAPALPP
ncbi:MAG: mevalonate kinase family protein [Thermoleophilaceae bacterium]